jgi:rare lipoprotein A
MHAPTAAHKTLPFGTWVRVVNQRNRKQAFVRINDRGPFVRGRIIDLSRKAAEDLDMIGSGTDVVSLYLTTKPKLQEPADTPTRTPTQGDWTIQVGSFSEYPRALRVAERFSEIDVRVRIEQFGALFRVRLGSFPSRQDAEHFSETLDLRDLDTWILDMNLERNKP